MNYPVWELNFIGGGSLIAFISIVHVYVAHLAVGAGFFLWYMDRLGFREKNPAIHEYVRKHTFFFLLLSMVFGGVTGVGIWFIIALVHPSATSMLIHSFVFLWAIEWVFFLCEIVSLLLYHYRFNKLGEKRLVFALLYGFFAWMSLFIINGIICFMLTPGSWLKTGSMAAAFFNPTFFPSLFFRTAMSLGIAALFGHVTAVFMNNGGDNETVLVEIRKWLLVPLVLIIPCSLWYYFSLPYDVRVTMMYLNPQSMPFLRLFLAATVVLFATGLVLVRRRDIFVQRFLAILLLIIGQLWIGGFEYVREIARKPFVIQGYMYSTSVTLKDTDAIGRDGFLASARWTSVRQVTDENRIEAGRELFRLQCLSCHTIGGIRNDIIQRTRDLTLAGLESQLSGQGKMLSYMPPFMGTDDERHALALYIHKELNHGRETVPVKKIMRVPDTIMPDTLSGEYILFAWSDRGMNELSGNRWFIPDPAISPSISSILIKKGDTPERTSSNISITYRSCNPDPSISGEMVFSESNGRFTASGIKVQPWKKESFNPYPLFQIEAKDKTTGKVLARTGLVIPVTDETGCGRCHGNGEPSGRTGLSESAAMAILSVHDRANRTDLLARAAEGRQVMCTECHREKGSAMNLSASIHAWHASYMPEDASSCTTCHPAGGDSSTGYFRGFHSTAGLTCVECHGNMRQHSLSLVAGDKIRSIRLNERYLHKEGEVVVPRKSGESTDCLACHKDYKAPDSVDASGSRASGDNSWKKREDGAGLPCIMCHGSAHALYPCSGDEAALHNLQPLKYTGKPYPVGSDFNCAVCHGRAKTDSPHHDNMMKRFRNR